MPFLNEMPRRSGDSGASIHIHVRRSPVFAWATETHERDIQPLDDGKPRIVIFDARQNKPIDAARLDEFFVDRVKWSVNPLGEQQDVVSEILGAFHNAPLKLFQDGAVMILRVLLP